MADQVSRMASGGWSASLMRLLMNFLACEHRAVDPPCVIKPEQGSAHTERHKDTHTQRQTQTDTVRHRHTHAQTDRLDAMVAQSSLALVERVRAKASNRESSSQLIRG